MDPVTTLVLTSTLVSLLGFLVLVFPLVFMFAGQLRPWFEQLASERAAAAAILPRQVGPAARRTATSRGSTGKVAIARSTGSGAKAKAKSSAKPKSKKKATKKAATKKKTTAKKAAAKKAAAKKSPTKKKAAAKKKAAEKKSKASPKSAKKKAAPTGATIDPELGVVYKKKPADADDLKKISGVAKVLEGKLHAEGVYTYQQIADWTPAQMEAFGERLSFKNRIQRDDWKKQAKALQKKKKA